jgi:hypothetical protein
LDLDAHMPRAWLRHLAFNECEWRVRAGNLYGSHWTSLPPIVTDAQHWYQDSNCAREHNIVAPQRIIAEEL